MSQWVQCQGWWEQRGLGRQTMEELLVAFGDGGLHGSGADVVGRFTLSGSLVGDRALVRKQYLGGHAVDYAGQWDGEGTLQGTWRLAGDEGPWWMRVVAARDPSAAAEIPLWPGPA